MFTKNLIQILSAQFAGLKTFLVSSTAKRFYWNTANGIIGLLITYYTGSNLALAPLYIAALNGITKAINKKITPQI